MVSLYLILSYIIIDQMVNANDESFWHERIGHIGHDKMNKLARCGLFGSLSNVKLPTYEFCLQGKITRKPFSKGTKSDGPLLLIHSDICGPMNVLSRQGFR